MLESVNRRCKVAHIVNLSTVGGVERLFTQLIAAPSSEFEHHTIVERAHISPVLEPEIRRYSHSIHFIKRCGFFRIPKWPDCIRNHWLRRVLGKIGPDIVVVWNCPKGYPEFVFPDGSKVLYYEHGGVWIHSSQPEAANFINRVDGIIANSQAAKQVLRLRWPELLKAKIDVCVNPLLPSLAAAARPSNEWGRQAPKFPNLELGIAGRLVPLKGVVLAIKTAEQLSLMGWRPRLHIAGDGPELEFLQGVAKRVQGVDIIFHGQLPCMEAFYQELDVLLCPSLWESFGLVAIEALAYSVPVVAAAIDGLPEALGEPPRGCLVKAEVSLEQYKAFGGSVEGIPQKVFDPQLRRLVPARCVDPIKMAEAVHELCCSPERYQQVSEESPAYVQQNFSFNRYLDQIQRVFRAYLD